MDERNFTRMDLQKKYDTYKKMYGHNRAVKELEKEFGVKKVVVNKSGQIAYFESINKTEHLLQVIEVAEKEVGEMSEVDSKKLQKLLRAMINVLKVRGIVLNKTEQENLIFMFTQALK